MTVLDKLSDITGHHAFCEKASKCERFVISDKLIAIMGRDDVQRSIAAVIEAGICALPFDSVLIEAMIEPPIRRFVWLRQGVDVIEAQSAWMRGDQAAGVMNDTAQLSIEGSGLRLRNSTDPSDSASILIAAAIALLLLNTKGVDLEFVDPSRLNKARAAKGKTLKPPYTHVKIGKIYDRSGRVSGERKGIKQPVHFRAGYVRTVHYGPDRSLTRKDYVAPCIVNYAGEMPKPKERRVSP